MIKSLTAVACSALVGATVSHTPETAKAVSGVSASAAVDSILTVDAVNNMTAFYTAFMKEPASVNTAGRQAHQKKLTVNFGGSQPAQFTSVVDMVGMAGAFPEVAKDLKDSHLSAEQWEENRLALFGAVIAAQQGTTPPATSAVAQNITFLQAHQQEFGALQASGMWFPQAQAAAGGQGGGAPQSFAAVQAQDQQQTAQNNQFVYGNPPVASPRDTTKAKVGGANVLIDYGRPSVGGRDIFSASGLVPFGQVWRTGANMATTIITDKDLMIGTLAVPKGSYTLYTTPDQASWTLMVNKENGQWGLTYHPEYDLGSTKMTVATSNTPVEKFLIDIKDGKLRMSWDKTVAEVPISEKK